MARTEISSGQIIQIYEWSHLTLFSHPINGLYHNVSPCHFSDRIHVSLMIYSQIYFWSGDGLPGPTFCDGSDLDSYMVMLCSPVGRCPHHCVCLRGNEVEGSDWKKKIRVVALRPWNSQHLVWLVQSCSRDQAGNQNVRQMFVNSRKIDNFCKFPCFSLLLWASACLNHRSVTPKFVTPTAPSCIDNSWRSTTLPGADSASSNQTLPFQNEHKWVLEKLT